MSLVHLRSIHFTRIARYVVIRITLQQWYNMTGLENTHSFIVHFATIGLYDVRSDTL